MNIITNKIKYFLEGNACTYRASKDLCPLSGLTLNADIRYVNVPKFSNRPVFYVKHKIRSSLSLFYLQ